MDRMVYTAMTGALQSEQRQDIVANNLANVSTDGFKSQLALARSVPVNGPGWQSRVAAVETTPGSDLSQGPIENTGNPLDVAIKGDGWLAVADDQAGEAYTRDGALSIDATGVLNSGNRAVLDEDGQPIVLPLSAESITIGDDGTISAIEGGELPDTITEVARLKLVNPEEGTLVRSDDGMFRQRTIDGEAPPPLAMDENVRVASGAVEGSNVSPTKAMVNMIANARQFEMQMKSISTADENAGKANELLSI